MAFLLLADLSSMTLDGSAGDPSCPQGTQTWPVRRSRTKKSRGGGPETPVLENLPVSVTFDMKYVLFVILYFLLVSATNSSIIV